MADFKILTDSCGDLSPALITQLELDVFPMFFHLGGKDRMFPFPGAFEQGFLGL